MISGKKLPFAKLLPGLLLTLAVSMAALLVEEVQIALSGARFIEALVIAIVIGAVVRSVAAPGERFHAGIGFSAKTLLEIAVVLIGASITTQALANAGGMLIAVIATIVVVSLISSYGIGRMFGLSHRLATLVACGNSICGNSAIAATAPAIGASADDVASSIAFTAILGVGAVLLMPLLQHALGLSAVQYGTFAGLTVYAVPQVLAAAAPAGLASVQAGTLVKLIRVLMLGPVIFVLGLVHGMGSRRITLHHIVPWFILGFMAMAGLRSAALIPEGLLAPISAATNLLTLLSMAALGLSVDIRQTARAGGRVIAAASLSLAALSLVSLIAIRMLPLA